jgi:hypothetical protein
MLKREDAPKAPSLTVLFAATACRNVQCGRKIAGHFEAGVNRRHDGLGPGLHLAFLLPIETGFDVGSRMRGVNSPLYKT